MHKALDNLALRKQLLQARSALYRLRIRREFNTLRDNLTWARAGAIAFKALPVGSSVFALALSALPHSRLTRILALASRTLLLARWAPIALGLLRKFSTPPVAIRERTDRLDVDLKP